MDKQIATILLKSFNSPLVIYDNGNMVLLVRAKNRVPRIKLATVNSETSGFCQRRTHPYKGETNTAWPERDSGEKLRCYNQAREKSIGGVLHHNCYSTEFPRKSCHRVFPSSNHQHSWLLFYCLFQYQIQLSLGQFSISSCVIHGAHFLPFVQAEVAPISRSEASHIRHASAGND
jgi:hypothetical protein